MFLLSQVGGCVSRCVRRPPPSTSCVRGPCVVHARTMLTVVPEHWGQQGVGGKHGGIVQEGMAGQRRTSQWRAAATASSSEGNAAETGSCPRLCNAAEAGRRGCLTRG